MIASKSGVGIEVTVEIESKRLVKSRKRMNPRINAKRHDKNRRQRDYSSKQNNKKKNRSARIALF